jgi:hypothetical protein
MDIGIPDINDLRSQRFYHGTRADLKPGDLIEPGNLSDVGERDRMTIYAYLTRNLDAAIWGQSSQSAKVPAGSTSSSRSVRLKMSQT